MWGYWGGYVASFTLVFILAVTSGRNRAKNGKSTSSIIDMYAQHLLLGLLFSFASWVMFIFLMGYVVIFVGTGAE